MTGKRTGCRHDRSEYDGVVNINVTAVLGIHNVRLKTGAF
jgi:hypothetical protein